MKLNLIVALSVLALVALSCGTIPAITQAVQPTYTLYPTQVPPTQIPPTPIAIPVRTSLDTILVNNGYSRWVEGDQYCDHKCKSWLYPAQGLLAQSYPDGSVTLGITVSDQYDASTRQDDNIRSVGMEFQH